MGWWLGAGQEGAGGHSLLCVLGMVSSWSTDLSETEGCTRLDQHKHRVHCPLIQAKCHLCLPAATLLKEASHPLAQGESPQQCLQTENMSFSTEQSEQWPLTGVELERRKKELRGLRARRGVECRGAEETFCPQCQPSPFPQRHPQGNPWALPSCSLRTQAYRGLAPPPQPHPGHLPPTGKLVTSITQRFKTAPTTPPAG